MCIQYVCMRCGQPAGIYCESAITEELDYCDRPTIDLWPGAKTCHTCCTIDQVTQELNVLLFREPWLETEGMAGAPAKESWEQSATINWYPDSEDDNDGMQDGFTKEEREKFRANFLTSRKQPTTTTSRGHSKESVEPCISRNEYQSQYSSQQTAVGSDESATLVDMPQEQDLILADLITTANEEMPHDFSQPGAVLTMTNEMRARAGTIAETRVGYEDWTARMNTDSAQGVAKEGFEKSVDEWVAEVKRNCPLSLTVTEN